MIVLDGVIVVSVVAASFVLWLMSLIPVFCLGRNIKKAKNAISDMERQLGMYCEEGERKRKQRTVHFGSSVKGGHRARFLG